MRHLRVQWLHDHPDELVELWSEIDENRWETRKVDVFEDGRLQAACKDFSTSDTQLGLIPTPGIKDINADEEFRAEYVSAEDFEEIWRQAFKSK